MPVDLDDLYPSNPPRWWRYRGEWKHGWTDYELQWIAEGRPAPEHWDYHREGTRWENVSYFQVRNCYAAGHPNSSMYVWVSPYGGHRQVVQTCEDCGEKFGGAVGTRKLRALGLDRNQLPVANLGVVTENVCVRCGGEDDVEYHHWAPRHLFDDANSWPGDYLCRGCHTHWHRTVTPNMNAKRSPAAKAREALAQSRPDQLKVSQWLTDLVNREAAS